MPIDAPSHPHDDDRGVGAVLVMDLISTNERADNIRPMRRRALPIDAPSPLHADDDDHNVGVNNCAVGDEDENYDSCWV